MFKQERIQIAKETIHIITMGQYIIRQPNKSSTNNLNQLVSMSAEHDTEQKIYWIANDIKKSIDSSEYVPESIELKLPDNLSNYATVIEVTRESTLDAIMRLSTECSHACDGTNNIEIGAANKHSKQVPLALNFASATKAGGGFLNGALAQEESIAYASALYPTLVKLGSQMYANNLGRCNDGLYCHDMIYSHNVPIFRNNNYKLIPAYYASFISCPAVNAGIYYKRNKNAGIKKNNKVIHAVMNARIMRILTLAALKGYTHLVLGAYGTGVFQCDPVDTAKIFKTALNNRFRGVFKKVVFAIYDPTDSYRYDTFRDILLTQ